MFQLSLVLLSVLLFMGSRLLYFVPGVPPLVRVSDAAAFPTAVEDSSDTSVTVPAVVGFPAVAGVPAVQEAVTLLFPSPFSCCSFKKSDILDYWSIVHRISNH
jgi:hypothetical protein